MIDDKKRLRVLIFTESFYPYTSGIARRFIEIISRLAVKNFKIHILTGIKVKFRKFLKKFLIFKYYLNFRVLMVGLIIVLYEKMFHLVF